MTKRRLRNAGSRPKAFLGADSGAILAAAGINVAGTLAASAIGASATKKAAQDQAKATLQSAQRQAQAIKDQTERSKEYQTEAQEFVKEQNAENRELQKDIQLQLQMLTGQQNVNDRLEASKIKVKAGGKTKRLGFPQSLLRGGNMPFQVTDGGGVVPVGVTPEGFELYEIFGNDHEHYHKTRGGKYKSGVGIKFADGNVVEGEGNQKKNGGELMLVTPDNAYFISKHNINGFNPAESVKAGLHPLQAYAIQEQEKDITGTNDDGTRKAKCGTRKYLIGGSPTLYTYAQQLYPQVGIDTIGNTAVGVAYATPFRQRIMKSGGRVRFTGGGPGNGGRNNYYGGNYSTPTTSTKPSFFSRVTGGVGRGLSSAGRWIGNAASKVGNWMAKNAEITGAGINALGNIGGAWITAAANRSAARTLADAYNQGADIMANAYRNMQTIDMDSIRKEDYAAAHTMPVLQAPVSFAASNIAGVDRKLQRRLRNAGRYSASSAVAQERMANADIEAQDEKNRIYSADQQQMQQIRQANAERVTEASRMNAMLDTQANQQYGQDYLKLLQYNNDIENTKILGAAGATSEGAINGASAISQGQIAGAQAWANAVSNIGLSGANMLSSMAKRKADLENVMLGSDMAGQVNYVSRNGTKAEKAKLRESIQSALATENLSAQDKATYNYYIKLLS